MQVLPQPPGPVAGLLAFDGHHVVAADVDEHWVRARLPARDLSAPTQAGFLDALASQLGRRYDNLDAVFAAPAEEGHPELDLEEVPADAGHPRVARALAYRRDVTVYETPGGDAVLLVGRGLAERWEAAFEVDPSARGRGMGRSLIRAARRLVPVGEPIFLQVAPGNVSSTRAVLGAGGFRPVGAEVLFPDPDPPSPGLSPPVDRPG